MSPIFDYLFGTATLRPLGFSLLWRPDLVALHVISDALIAVAYLVIPAAIWVVLRRRRDLPPDSRRVAYLFVGFIVACALTHLVGLVTMWQPVYGLHGLMKAATAVISVTTALAVWPLIPRILALPSPGELATANAALANANLSLTDAVSQRTHEMHTIRHRFEMALAGSNITVFTQDRDLRYTWIHNPRHGQQTKDILGRTDAELLPPDAAAKVTSVKEQSIRTGETLSRSVSIVDEHEGTAHLDLTVSPTRNSAGEVDGVLCTVLDLTEQRLFEMRLAALAGQLGTANSRFRLALENSPITVFEQDSSLRYTFMENPPPGTQVEDYLDRTDFDLFSEAEVSRLAAPKQRVFETGNRETFETDVMIGGETRFYHVTLEPKFDGRGAVVGIVGTAVDLSERRRSERQMRLVMRELTHRSKNLLAVIQSMARKTASQSGSIEEFVTDFSARLRSIAAAQDLLVSESWSGADLRELLRDTLAQTIDPDNPQIEIEGPQIMLPPEIAQNLGLAFHELATNALRHGALSVDGGRLCIVWRIHDGGVRLHWGESGGPPAEDPGRRGFGRVLLERLVGPTIQGTVALHFRPQGLVCDIAFPLQKAAV